MGLTGEYVFTYSELTGDIKIVRYEASSREVIVGCLLMSGVSIWQMEELPWRIW